MENDENRYSLYEGRQLIGKQLWRFDGEEHDW